MNLTRCDRPQNITTFNLGLGGKTFTWGKYGYIFVKMFEKEQDIYTILNLYLIPLGVTLTLLFSTLLLAVLLRSRMRTCTNAFLSTMAVFDMTCALLKLLYYIMKCHAPITSEFFDSYPWLCTLLFFCDRAVLPRSLHLTTLSLTLAMAVYRYIYVGHPSTTKKICKPAVVGITIAVTCLLLTPFHFSPLFYLDLPQPYVPTNRTECKFLRNLVDVNKMGHCALRVVKSRDIRDTIDHAESIFAFIVLLCLIGFTVALLKAIRDLQYRRKEKLSRKNSKEASRASFSLVFVLGVIVLIESPGIIMGMYNYIVNKTLRDQGIFSHRKGQLMTHYLIMEKVDIVLAAWLYPVVFFTFCITSAQFRVEFKKIFQRQSLNFHTVRH